MATFLETRVKTVSKSSPGKLLSNSVHSDWMNHDPEALQKQDKLKTINNPHYIKSNFLSISVITVCKTFSN
jgi:hypothetical protein